MTPSKRLWRANPRFFPQGFQGFFPFQVSLTYRIRQVMTTDPSRTVRSTDNSTRTSARMSVWVPCKWLQGTDIRADDCVESSAHIIFAQDYCGCTLLLIRTKVATEHLHCVCSHCKRRPRSCGSRESRVPLPIIFIFPPRVCLIQVSAC